MALKSQPEMAIGQKPEIPRHAALLARREGNAAPVCPQFRGTQDLAQALLILRKADERRESMGRAGRRRALQSFSWDPVAQGIRDRYERLCKPAMTLV